MKHEVFISYYQILELSPNAGPKTIARKFRSLASRYHPDNQGTGDRAKFDRVVLAHDTLKDLIKRRQYHEEHSANLPPFPQEFEEEQDTREAEEVIDGQPFVEEEKFIESIGVDRDVSVQNNMLTLLYLQRRRNIKEPGIGNEELARLTGCDLDHLEFHIWYLRAKGWIATGENGLLAITVTGVDRATQIYQGEKSQKLIIDQS